MRSVIRRELTQLLGVESCFAERVSAETNAASIERIVNAIMLMVDDLVNYGALRLSVD